MARHRIHSLSFKKQIVQEYAAGATLNGLAREHDVSRNLIRVWVAKSESGEFDPEVEAATLLGDYEAKIVALERMVGRQALDEFLKGALQQGRFPRSAPMSVIAGPGVSRRSRMPADGHRSIDLLRCTCCRSRCRDRCPHRGDLREFEAYGYRRVTAELRHQGQLVNSKRVRRLMREHGLSPKQRRRYVTTTDSDHDEPIFPNLTADMAPDGPNQLWVADITYVAIATGFVYLAAILDAWSRRVVGYAISRSIDARLTIAARTARKWVDRFKAEGLAGLADRSSRPQRLRQPTSPAVVDQVIGLRRQRLPGQHIAKVAGVSPATVSRILKRAGVSRLRDLEPPEPVRRYERQHPGELIHIDIKKLGRFHQVGHRITGDRRRQSNARSRGEGAGWEFVHVCIDDASRIAFTMIMPDEKAKSAIAFLKAAVAYYNSLGVTVAGVMTDNGSCHKAFAFARACKRLKLKHIRTRPYPPKTNGKAERFIQTALREWAYAKPYNTSNERAQQLQPWTHAYNWHRPHGSLKANTPISRLGLSEDNLLRLHI